MQALASGVMKPDIGKCVYAHCALWWYRVMAAAGACWTPCIRRLPRACSLANAFTCAIVSPPTYSNPPCPQTLAAALAAPLICPLRRQAVPSGRLPGGCAGEPQGRARRQGAAQAERVTPSDAEWRRVAPPLAYRSALREWRGRFRRTTRRPWFQLWGEGLMTADILAQPWLSMQVETLVSTTMRSQLCRTAGPSAQTRCRGMLSWLR